MMVQITFVLLVHSLLGHDKAHPFLIERLFRCSEIPDFEMDILICWDVGSCPWGRVGAFYVCEIGYSWTNDTGGAPCGGDSKLIIEIHVFLFFLGARSDFIFTIFVASGDPEAEFQQMK